MFVVCQGPNRGLLLHKGREPRANTITGVSRHRRAGADLHVVICRGVADKSGPWSFTDFQRCRSRFVPCFLGMPGVRTPSGGPKTEAVCQPTLVCSGCQLRRPTWVEAAPYVAESCPNSIEVEPAPVEPLPNLVEPPPSCLNRPDFGRNDRKVVESTQILSNPA